jgi:hypothetical protein
MGRRKKGRESKNISHGSSLGLVRHKAKQHARMGQSSSQASSPFGASGRGMCPVCCVLWLRLFDAMRAGCCRCATEPFHCNLHGTRLKFLCITQISNHYHSLLDARLLILRDIYSNASCRLLFLFGHSVPDVCSPVPCIPNLITHLQHAHHSTAQHNTISKPV